MIQHPEHKRKIIARFMGVRPDTIPTLWNAPEYDKDWNLLMPVVLYIERMVENKDGFSLSHHPARFFYKSLSSIRFFDNDKNLIDIKGYGEDWREQLFDCCFRFIDYLNKNQC